MFEIIKKDFSVPYSLKNNVSKNPIWSSMTISLTLTLGVTDINYVVFILQDLSYDSNSYLWWAWMMLLKIKVIKKVIYILSCEGINQLVGPLSAALWKTVSLPLLMSCSGARQHNTLSSLIASLPLETICQSNSYSLHWFMHKPALLSVWLYVGSLFQLVEMQMKEESICLHQSNQDNRGFSWICWMYVHM